MGLAVDDAMNGVRVTTQCETQCKERRLGAGHIEYDECWCDKEQLESDAGIMGVTAPVSH